MMVTRFALATTLPSVFASHIDASQMNHLGLWLARSPEIIHSKAMETLVWLRVPGDIVFAGGAVLLALYAFKLLRRAPAQRKSQSANLAEAALSRR